MSAFFDFPFAAAATDPCSSDIAGQTKAQLQADLDACNAEIAEWTATLNNTKAQSASYQRDVDALTAKIKAAEASIKAKNIAIANLSKDIASKQATITTLQGKIEASDASLAEIIRATNKLDSYSLPEAVLSDKSLSDFFVDINAYASTESALEAVLSAIRGTKSATEAAKADLAAQKDAAAAVLNQIEAQKKQVQSDQEKKQALLSDSQSKEKAYSDLVAQQKAKADEIRAALFGLRDTAAIQFGTALEYAQEIQKATGIDPAFLLAIITQESALGQNVGACNLADSPTSKKWYSIMPGPDAYAAYLAGGKSCRRATGVCSSRDDQTPYKKIIASLGKDLDSTPLSCPILSAGPWGGAMGPAQFIPSTWMLFQSRITSATGDPTPNPWNAKDAFAAAALYLSDLGASGGNYTAERNAACRYYGTSCSTYSAYGDQVMAKAANIQSTMIDPLQGV